MAYPEYDEMYRVPYQQKMLSEPLVTSVVVEKPIENKLLTLDDQKKNIFEIIGDELKVDEGKGVILIEPEVDIKFKQMMALAGNKEVFAKLMVTEDAGYLTVKDVYIPYQCVTGGSFNSKDELLNKFLYELSFEDLIAKKDRPIEELNFITSNLNGHFHSHNSISKTGKPSPSITDTTDMIENREDRPYWIEIIGTMGGYSGRITITKPILLMAEVEVRVKWWKGIDDILNITKDKIYTDYTYKADVAKKKAQEEKDRLNPPKKVESRANLTVDERKTLKEIKKWTKEFNKEKEKNDKYNNKLVSKYIGSMKWDKNDPLQIHPNIVPRQYQEKIAKNWESLLEEGEEIMLDIFSGNTIDWVIINKGEIVEFVLDRWRRTFPDAYKMWEKYTDLSLCASDDLNDFYSVDGVKKPRYRTVVGTESGKIYRIVDGNGIEVDIVKDTKRYDYKEDMITKGFNERVME